MRSFRATNLQADRDRLLGHAKKTIEQKHYGAADWKGLQRAVESIKIDLFAPSTEENLVSQESSKMLPAHVPEAPKVAEGWAPPARLERTTFGLGNHRRLVQERTSTSLRCQKRRWRPFDQRYKGDQRLPRSGAGHRLHKNADLASTVGAVIAVAPI